MAFKPATERDFRKPEFAYANPEDYEILESGRVVAKDRYQRVLLELAAVMGNHYSPSIDDDDVVDLAAVLVGIKLLLDANRELLSNGVSRVSSWSKPTLPKKLNAEELTELWHEMEREHASGFRYEVPFIQFADALLKKTDELNS